jgi:hypothetical protein
LLRTANDGMGMFSYRPNRRSMSDTPWVLRGREFLHCSCDYGCPCQFNALPTHGYCRAVFGLEIQEGHHGNTPLNNLNIAAIAAWPKAIHEGHGQMLPIVDERADQAQRAALVRIMNGLDTEPGATFFQVFSTTYEKVHDPVFVKIEFTVDVEGRRAHLNVPGVLESTGEPILNPVTKQPHRVRINLPNGFEYTTAEVGRGWAKAKGPVQFDLENCHAHFSNLHMTGLGVVH